MKHQASDALFEKACRIIPGGVNSPVRACASVGVTPLFIKQARGCRIQDEDGNTYIDYVGSWGPMILGHRHPAVLEAVMAALERGTSFGAPVDLEIQLAELIIEAVPSVEVVRMVNSGTEAAMSAVRLARGVTDRELILKFDGCYHGHADTLLVAAGSGVATLAIPGSPGIPESIAAGTLSLPYNDIETFTKTMAAQGDHIAAVIVEPVAGNMGLVPPAPDFLATLRRLTEQHGSLLIFDEVMTGFRVAHGGAQAHFGILPDITCLGKVIGGGLPVGAYGGRQDIMAHIAPQGSVYQAGTLSGNPVAMAAGIATLKELKKPGIYQDLNQKSERLLSGLAAGAAKAGLAVTTSRVGAMLGLFFTPGPVRNFQEAKTSDLEIFGRYYRGMLEKGIYLAPSQFEAFFMSSAHDQEAIAQTIQAAGDVFQSLK